MSLENNLEVAERYRREQAEQERQRQEYAQKLIECLGRSREPDTKLVGLDRTPLELIEDIRSGNGYGPVAIELFKFLRVEAERAQREEDARIFDLVDEIAVRYT